jgi:NAD(P)H dehydrogenase (quinone)
MQTQLDVGIFAYCGVTDVESHMIFDVEGDNNRPQRDTGLQTARRIGEAFVNPHRVRRNAKEEHLRQR